MNFIYMHTHDTGRCYQSYGYPVVTPNEMALADLSLQFNNCICCAPTCSPSRAAMLTGQCAHASGMLGLAHRGFSLNPKQHLAYWLGQNGYETALCGVQHEAKDEKTLPYQRFLYGGVKLVKRESGTAYDLANADAVSAFLHEKHDKPFFLSFGLRNTHRPYPVHTSNPDRFRAPAMVPNTPETRIDAADFSCAIDAVDACIGKVLQALRETGHEEDTILLFTTDHGPAFPHMKCTLRDGGIGVTLLIKAPCNQRAGQVTDQLVSHVDVFPTVCDLLNVSKPEWLQGVSLMPLLKEDIVVREEAFSEVTYHAAYEPLRSIRTRRYKLIRRFDFHNGVVPSNIDASYSKTVMAQAGLLDTVRPREELYDLLLDPMETNNLVMDASVKEIYIDLSSRLWRWMQETNDPLLTNTPRVPKPQSARINALAAINPDDDCWEE